MTSRRRLIARLPALAAWPVLPALPTPARAQAAFPSRPIRAVLPFGPGTGTDVMARRVMQKVTETHGWSFVVDNKPGANGFIAMRDGLQAPPDGHTVFFTGNTTHGANSAMFKSLPYDPVQDFTPVTRLGVVPLVLLVAASSPARTAAQLVERARQQPGRLSYAWGSAGPRLAAEMLNQQARLQTVSVPYKSSSQASTDLVGGSVDLMFLDTIASMPLIRNGSVRPLAVTAPRRVAALPEVPTTAEAGLPGIEVSNWSAVFVRRGTPAPIVEQLHAGFSSFAKSADGRKYIEDLGGYIEPLGPAQTSDWVRAEIENYSTTFRRAGVEPE